MVRKRHAGSAAVQQVPAARVRAFRKKIYAYYLARGRDLPWRRSISAYRVLVSEIMLQQTQVERVREKFVQFLQAFPDFPSLARAPLPRLLKIWQGLGYNRRALALRELARIVVADYRGRLPSDPEQLLRLPGIGPYTAGAVAAFAFNKPVVFMDTNIRRVYLHEFFPGREGVRDDELIPIVERTLDAARPRKWYNALMDYGAFLKREQGNPNRRSAHYTRQAPFENSHRQVRGKIVRLLVEAGPLAESDLTARAGGDPLRVSRALAELVDEGFVARQGRIFRIA